MLNLGQIYNAYSETTTMVSLDPLGAFYKDRFERVDERQEAFELELGKVDWVAIAFMLGVEIGQHFRFLDNKYLMTENGVYILNRKGEKIDTTAHLCEMLNKGITPIKTLTEEDKINDALKTALKDFDLEITVTDHSNEKDLKYIIINKNIKILIIGNSNLIFSFIISFSF